MKFNCRYSLVLHIMLVALHGVALCATILSSAPSPVKLVLIPLLGAACLYANRELAEGSSDRIGSFEIHSNWAALERGGQIFKVSLPAVLYVSEYVIAMEFAQFPDDRTRRGRLKHYHLLLLPGMLSPEQNCALRRHLRFRKNC